ncbi:tRNA pseudouridine(65) synthase TruC [Alteromonas portus]|uniref:tRNA pseudouridine(65) synthase TruC n=1 Tax=Alteromonas portus TaxID=2565549 RepID=UPI003BF86A79
MGEQTQRTMKNDLKGQLTVHSDEQIIGKVDAGEEDSVEEDSVNALHLPVLYQDEHIIAIEKPSGLLVHRSPIDRHETVFAVQTLRDQIGQHVYPAHRLDRPTSGVLVFSFSSEIAAKLGQQMMDKQVVKAYHAIVRGFVHHTGYIDYALKYRYDKIADKHKRPQQPPQPASTMYQSVAKFEVPEPVGKYQSARYSLVKLFPSTGRKHQLRRHMVHIRHPIIGDTTHGDGKQNKFAKQHFNFNNLALSCTHMGFSHPVTGKWVTINSQMHSEMRLWLEKLAPFCV